MKGGQYDQSAVNESQSQSQEDQLVTVTDSKGNHNLNQTELFVQGHMK